MYFLEGVNQQSVLGGVFAPPPLGLDRRRRRLSKREERGRRGGGAVEYGAGSATLRFNPPSPPACELPPQPPFE